MSEFKLTFDVLRAANKMRLPLFKNGKGEIAHSKPDGSDWSPGEWVCAVTGELGELANIIKKIRRGDVTVDNVRQDLTEELADVACYLDILAMQFGIDLGDAIANKFNKVSDRVRTPIRICEAQSEWYSSEGLVPDEPAHVVNIVTGEKRTE